MVHGREQQLTHLHWYLASVWELQGIERIALIGSVLSDQSLLKDIDLLLSIQDGLDLMELATYTRRFHGRLMSIAPGAADVFLASSKHQYLGRVCLWKDCRAGARLACRALHCGQRQYLNDDLATIQLTEDLIRDPPVVLFPELRLSVAVPEDVVDLVLARLPSYDGQKEQEAPRP